MARAAIEAIANLGDLHPGDVVVLAGGPYTIGPAPNFIVGSAWSLESVLEHYTGVRQVRGGRNLFANEHGQLGLYVPHIVLPLPPEAIHRLRLFQYDAMAGYRPKPLLAVPAPGGRFRFASDPAAGGLTLDELKRRPDFEQIFFAHPSQGRW